MFFDDFRSARGPPKGALDQSDSPLFKFRRFLGWSWAPLRTPYRNLEGAWGGPRGPFLDPERRFVIFGPPDLVKTVFFYSKTAILGSSGNCREEGKGH